MNSVGNGSGRKASTTRVASSWTLKPWLKKLPRLRTCAPQRRLAMIRIVPSTEKLCSRSSAPVMPLAQPEPISAPIEVPEITLGLRPISSMASI